MLFYFIILLSLKAKLGKNLIYYYSYYVICKKALLLSKENFDKTKLHNFIISSLFNLFLSIYFAIKII